MPPAKNRESKTYRHTLTFNFANATAVNGKKVSKVQQRF